MPKLQLLFHGALIKELTITKTETTVGRSPDNDIAIDNPAVSGHHCRIGVDGDIYFVEDLNSTNGVYVNEEKTPRSDLKHDDVITVFKHTIKFLDDPSEVVEVVEVVESDKAMLPSDATIMITADKRESLAAAATAETQRKPAIIRVVKGLVDAAEYELDASSTYIGKSDLVQIKIKGAGWFRRAPENAAMIARRQDGYYISAVEEGYTKLNGATIRQKEMLKDGDLIEAGGTTLRFEEQESD
jgi:pSer/pThr/pTyr-binding forkhead associated (FHA) protein